MSIPITDKYLLYKPGLGNEADIRVLNHNTDNIDNGMYQNRRMIGDAYDPESTASNPYMTDDLVVKQTTIYDESDNPQSYSFQYYRCLEDNVYGPWDATKWEITDIATELKRRSGGGGASSLADLTDTDIDSPADGEVLTYDGENWVNAEGSATVTKTAEGNPIEFTDGSDAPLVECVTEIQGSQDLHGYDKPWVGGAGKNKLPKGVSGTSGTIEYTVNDDGSVLVTGTENSSTAFWGVQFSIPAGSYILNGCPAGGGNSSYLIDIRNAVGGGGIPGIAGDIGSGSSFTLSEPLTAYVNIRIASGYSIPSGGLLFKPMIRLSTVTDPTFAPYSNICPITAYTEGEIEVRGKNLLNVNASGVEVGKTILNDGTITIAPYCSVSDYIRIDGGVSVTSFTNGAVGGYKRRIVCFDKNKQFIATCVETTETPEVSVSITGVTVNGTKYIRIPYATSGASNQVEIGTTTTDYEPYIGTTHTTTYPSAIYRGSEDCVNGEVTSEWVKIVLDGSNDEEWYQHNTYNTQFGINFDGMNLGIDFRSQAYTNDLISNSYDCNYKSASTRPNGNLSCYEGVFGNQQGGKWFALRDDRFTSLSDFKTWLASNPLEIAYKRITKTDTVTTTNLPIKSLLGYNHIESSTGDMEVEYITEEFQPLVDLIADSSLSELSDVQIESPSDGDVLTWDDTEGKWVNAEGGGGGGGSTHVYSTTPQKVGEWINGSDIMEVTYDFGSAGISVPAGQWYQYSTQILPAGARAISCIGVTVDSNWGWLSEPMPIYQPSSDNTSVSFYGPQPNGLWMRYAIIQYIAPSTQTRSLSLSKGEISGEKKKADEEPIEEEKPVENDLDEWLEESEEIEEEVDEGTNEDSDVEEEEENEATNE